MTTSPESRAPQESAPELKPCQHCDQKPTTVRGSGKLAIVHGCLAADYLIEITGSEEVTAAAWNTRAPQAQKEEPQWLATHIADGTPCILSVPASMTIPGFTAVRSADGYEWLSNDVKPIPTPPKP